MVIVSIVARTAACLDGITALPNHGADWTAQHVYPQRQPSPELVVERRRLFRRLHTGYEALVEGLVREILVMLFEVLFRRRDKFHGCELVAEAKVSSTDIS